MAIDIDVEHSLVVLKELDDCKDAVINVAEPGSLLLLGMMKAASPVYSDVCAPLGNKGSASYASTSVYLTVVVHAVENRAIFPEVDYKLASIAYTCKSGPRRAPCSQVLESSKCLHSRLNGTL